MTQQKNKALPYDLGLNPIQTIQSLGTLPIRNIELPPNLHDLRQMVQFLINQAFFFFITANVATYLRFCSMHVHRLHSTTNTFSSSLFIVVPYFTRKVSIYNLFLLASQNNLWTIFMFLSTDLNLDLFCFLQTTV